jgi:hypothetical protein
MRTRLVSGLLALATVLLLAACTASTPTAEPVATSAAGVSAPASGAAGVATAQLTANLEAEPVAATDPYAHLATVLHARGVQIWFEADLVKRWLEGPAAFRVAVSRLGGLARQPGVVGFKVADELGYHDGLTSPEQAQAFLRDAHAALAKVAPGKQLLIDMVVPQLGCLAWKTSSGASCATSAGSTSPAATIAATTGYLRSGYVDRLDLSSGLLEDSTYRGWDTSIDRAQSDAWTHVQDLGWSRLTALQARKALADTGGYQGSAAQAAADVAIYVGTPTTDGAGAVDIWTWRQLYDGQTVSLLPADLTPNPLWTALIAARRDGVHLITHMSPSTMPSDSGAEAHECTVAAQAFDAVFVAAGTG